MKNIFSSLSDLTHAKVEIKENYAQTEKYTGTHAHTHTQACPMMKLCTFALNKTLNMQKCSQQAGVEAALQLPKMFVSTRTKQGCGAAGVHVIGVLGGWGQACSILLDDAAAAAAVAGDQK